MNSLIHKSAKLSFISMSALALFMNACLDPGVVGEESDSADGGDGDGDGDGTPLDCSSESIEERAPTLGQNDFGALAGTRWEGYFEGGVDVTLILGSDGTGSLLYGEDKDLAPPTDPDAGYFCNMVEDSVACGLQVNDGWNYPVGDAQVSGRRLQFAVDGADPWEDWCALQTPHRAKNRCAFETHPPYSFFGMDPEGKDCVAGNGDEVTAVDCDWLLISALRPVCECTSSECFSASERRLSFDLTANEELTEFSTIEGLHLFLVE